MKHKIAQRSFPTALLIAAGMISLSIGTAAQAGEKKGRAHAGWLVGTWYLALDTQPFGLPPGLPLAGIAQFHSDGTYQFQDAGDFGQATFLNTRHSYQFGSWRPTRGGKVIGTALFMEAELASGELLNWQKVRIVLNRTDERDVVSGKVTVSILPCSNMLPVPTAFTCPDPVQSAGDFVEMPPVEIPVTFRRILPGH